MTTRGIIAPMYEIECGQCGEVYRSYTWSGASGIRREALDLGWTTRPGRGPGSRSAPDLCPKHAPGEVSR